jgi:hypothetical protein
MFAEDGAMRTTRQFRRVTFGRRLDVQQLQAALSHTMVEMAKDPAPEAAPVRLEGVLVEPQQTTVYLSGNGPGLDAVAVQLGGASPTPRSRRRVGWMHGAPPRSWHRDDRESDRRLAVANRLVPARLRGVILISEGEEVT